MKQVQHGNSSGDRQMREGKRLLREHLIQWECQRRVSMGEQWMGGHRMCGNEWLVKHPA